MLTLPYSRIRFLPLFLLFQQLALAGGVAAVAFGGDVLAQGRDGFAGDDLAADTCPEPVEGPVLSLSKGRLDRELEKFPSFRYNIRMNTQLKITKIGNSAGVVLPKELLARLRVGPGDSIYATEAPDGVRLTAANPDFEAKIALAEKIMREDRDILRVLAK
jgi:putative addiction module antidote